MSYLIPCTFLIKFVLQIQTESYISAAKYLNFSFKIKNIDTF